MLRLVLRKRRRLMWCCLSVCLFLSTIQLVQFNESRQQYSSMFEQTVCNESLHVHTQTVPRKSIQYQENGYDRARSLFHKCHGGNETTKNVSMVTISQLLASSSGDIQLCPIWKVGTTLLKRLFMINNLKQYTNLFSPYDIPFDVRYKCEGSWCGQRISNSESAKRFIFTRDPYHRLTSGYVDKLLAPNPIYWGKIGSKAITFARQNASKKSIQCGHDLTFNEYVKYTIYTLSSKVKNQSPDMHFDRMTSLCRPCEVNYDFFGKMESFSKDSLEIVKQLDLAKVEKTLKNDGATLSADDALRDTVHQPFDSEFRRVYVKCISVHEALQRAWEKLQIRGLIGRQPLNVTEEEAEHLTLLHFTALARAAREVSTSKERSELKREHFLKMFSTVSKEDKEQLRKLYAEDFHLFGYDDHPSELFGLTDR